MIEGKLLEILINNCLLNGIFPDQLKIAKVCPIFKEGDKNVFTNYRPISILPCLSKVFEKIISERLLSFIHKNNILTASQYGFRRNHSTLMAILKVYDFVTKAIDNREFCAGIFIDLSKAFDTLDHSILAKKLEFYGFRGIVNKLMISYLTNRQQYVVYNYGSSNLASVQYGVPQGSILGPLLFLLYINDIDTISNLLVFVLFADDTTILCSNADIDELYRIINLEISKLSDWFRANKLSLNIKKTNYMLFGYKKYSHNSDDSKYAIQIDTTSIARVNCTRFLGVIIDDKLTWNKHICNIKLNISKALYSMTRLRYKLNKNCLLTLYYSFIYSQLNYCTLLWGNASKVLLNRLLLMQKRAVRIIDNCHHRSHTDPLFKNYNILKIHDLYVLSCCIFAYKYKNNLLPTACNNFMMLNIVNTPRYDIRNINDFLIPRFRTNVRQKCICIQGPTYWNSIPIDIRLIDNINTFKFKLRRHLSGA